MSVKVKYAPAKTPTYAELKTLLEAYKTENREMRKALGESVAALKLARKMLIDKEEENRKLKFIVLQLTEGSGE